MKRNPVPDPVASPAGPSRSRRHAFEPLLQFARYVGDFAQARLVDLERWMDVHAERRLRAAIAAGLVVLDRLVGVLQHAAGLDTEALDQRVAHRLDAAIEVAEIGARYVGSEANLAADQTRDRGQVARAVGRGVERERAEADVIAADRKQHQIDRALAVRRRTPLLGESLGRNAGAAVPVHRHGVARALGTSLRSAA